MTGHHAPCRRQGCRAALVGLAALLSFPLQAAATEVLVRVSEVANASGRVEVQLCRREEWLKDCVLAASAAAHPGTVTVTLADVPPGTYAAVAFHDANGNGKVDQNFIGIPEEGVGFSRVTSIPLGRPSFDAAALRVDGARVAVPVLLFFEPR